MIVNSMSRLKEAVGVPYIRQCPEYGVAYSTAMRWRSRVEAGREPTMVPGPKKVEPFDPADVRSRVGLLRHHRKRTEGTGELYRAVCTGISRRDLQAIIDEVRLAKNRDRRARQCRIEWLTPGLVWSMDDTEYAEAWLDGKSWVHSTRDLGSTYTFGPLTGPHLAPGEEVARNLERLFGKYGPPLFLKRDNGGNLNHNEVNRMLGENHVMWLNSPPYYAPYNGGIEQAQGELKAVLRTREHASRAELQLHARLSAHDLNHRKRPCLGGRTPCSLFFGTENTTGEFTKRKRREVYNEIIRRSGIITQVVDNDGDLDATWRLAVESWLLDHGHVTMNKTRECYPILTRLFAHN
jgi:hypothetical protein